MDYPEFISDPTSNLPDVFIFIGLLFFILSFIRYKDIGLIDDKDRVKLRIYGAIFFVFGYLLSFLYPIYISNPQMSLSISCAILGAVLIFISSLKNEAIQAFGAIGKTNKVRYFGIILLALSLLIFFYLPNAIIYGRVTDPIGLPIEGIRIEIDNCSSYSDINGEYEVGGVPRNARFIKFIFPSYEVIKKINIPIYSFRPRENHSYASTRLDNVTIDGIITDNQGNSIYSVWVVVSGGENLSSAKTLTDPYAHYNLSIKPYILSLITIRIFTVPSLTQPSILLYQENIKFSDDDLKLKRKRVDIRLNLMADVYGRVMKYCDQGDQAPVPVRGGIVEIGGRINLTDDQGNYFITLVSKTESVYTVNLTSGKNVSGSIIPPLNYEFGDRIVRDLWLCDDNATN